MNGPCTVLLFYLFFICCVNFFLRQPLFKVSAQEKSLNTLTDEEIDKIKKERLEGYSETQVLYPHMSGELFDNLL